MARRVTFPKLESPVAVAASQTYYVPAALDMEQGRAAVEHAIKHSALRPFDIASETRIDEVAPLWVPFWRLVVAAEGFHVDVSNVSVGSSGRKVPLPTSAGRYKEAVVMVSARSDFPYEPRLPSLFGRVAGIAPLEVGAEELVADPAPEMLRANGAEIVEADVSRERAESIVTELLLREVSPTHALYATYEPKIEEVLFCLYPLYHAHYTYSGEARRHPDEQLFVAVSGKTGEVVVATYPSAARAVAAKIRRFLSFDRRGA